MATAKPTLESLITRFRREAARPGATPELEVRFQGLDYANFAAIHQALLKAAEAAAAPPRLTQVVAAVMDQGAPRGAPRPALIREIYFEGGRKARERRVRKEPLVLPVRVAGAGAGLAYSVALAAEQLLAADEGFSADGGGVIRVKARASFALALVGTGEQKPPLEWRVDATVARQIAASDAPSALASIVDQMFRTKPAMTAGNLLAALRLTDDANPAPRELYQYEVEVELVGPAESRDLVRPADVAAAAAAVLRLANPEYLRDAALQAEVFRVAQYIVKAPGLLRGFQHELGLKRLLPQVVAITRADYRGLYPPRGLYLTVKADGRRAVGLAREGRGAVLADTLHEYAPPAGAAADPRLAADTVVDGELVGGDRAFHAFDVIAVAGENVSGDPFEARLGRLAEAVALLRAAGVPAEAKPYHHLAGGDARALEAEIRAALAAPRPYAADGLIFVGPGHPYDATPTYKWKSAGDNTIDFLARRAPPSVLGRAPFVDRPGHKLHFLFVGITPELFEALGLQRCPGYADLFGARAGGAYFPVQFTPSDAPLAYLYQHPDGSPLGDVDGKVVEGRCAGGCLAAGGGAATVDWEMVRVRDDRRRELRAGNYYGNTHHVAETTWLNYIDPFPVEQLWEGPALDYFMQPKSGVYRAQTAVVSYVKTLRIESLKHADWVVDLGAGKGQDLRRYIDAQVKNLVAVDRDRAALAELVRRRLDLARRGDRGRPGDRHADERGRGRHRGAATVVHVLVADAAEPYAATVRKFEPFGLRPGGADALVCNLAAHYFLPSVEGVRNFVALTRAAVKIGGRVVLTVLIGEEVHALFAAEGVAAGGAWDLRENGALKYSLKRLYSSPTLEAAGQRVGVLLPFSDGQYYEEFLVNTKALTAEYVARGFSLLAATNVAAAIPDFEARNRPLAAQLTAGDRRYLGLYGELVFQRDK